MKKFNFTLLVCLLLAGIFASCDDDDKYPVPPEVSIESVNGVFAMPQEDSIVLKAKVESPLPTTLSWSVKGNEVSKDTVFTFKMNELGTYDVKLTATNADGVTSATTSIEVYGKYKYGTFVLNEGYQADPSTLIFISPKGILTDSAYYKANGSMLSLLSQDLFIANNKLYIISQKSGDDGYLIVANAETLKKEAGYKTELEDKVSSPVILLGAGGAARAIAFLCVSKGAKEVAILNRTEEKAAVIAEDVNRHLQSKAAYAMKLSDYGKLTGENYVVIQTTSVGLYPNCDDAVIEDEDFYKRAAVGVDIIYNPAETKFIFLFSSRSLPFTIPRIIQYCREAQVRCPGTYSG